MNPFIQALLTISQTWAKSLPSNGNGDNNFGCYTNDFIHGLLVFLSTTLNSMANCQPAPHPLGHGLVNFWSNLNVLLNPAKTPLISRIIQQGLIDQNTINQLQGRINLVIGGTALQPSTPEIIAALKVIVGLIAAQGQTADSYHRWALLFLVFWVITQGFYNDQDALDLYHYFFLHGMKPAKVLAITDPLIIRLLPACGTDFHQQYGCNQPNRLSSHCNQYNCHDYPETVWRCNPSHQQNYECIQRQRMCDPRPRASHLCDDDCAFPKAACFLFQGLGQEAKYLLRCDSRAIDWCALSCVLKKMLIVGMFAGKRKNKNYDCGCGVDQCDGNCQGGLGW